MSTRTENLYRYSTITILKCSCKGLIARGRALPDWRAAVASCWQTVADSGLRRVRAGCVLLADGRRLRTETCGGRSIRPGVILRQQLLLLVGWGRWSGWAGGGCGVLVEDVVSFGLVGDVNGAAFTARFRLF